MFSAIAVAWFQAYVPGEPERILALLDRVERAGFGTLVEGYSGFAAINGFEDREPVLPPLAMADMIAGLSGAMATVIAVRNVEVNGGRGQVMHSQGFLMISTACPVCRGEGPAKMLVSLGYAGWSAGQIEHELKQNAWLTVEAKDAILFDLPADERLPAAMELLGLDYARLADQAGHA